MGRWLRAVIVRLTGSFGRRPWEADHEAELRATLELHVEENLRAGMTAGEARRAAHLRMGSIAAARDRYRDQRTIPALTALTRDLRHSARLLRRSPGFSLAVVATLALCIGGNTAVSSLLYDLVLEPLPFRDADRIVEVFKVYRPNPSRDSQVGWLQYRDFKEQASLFEGFALLSPTTAVANGAPQELLRVTADFFDVMGVEPVLGRFFTPDEVNPTPDQEVRLARLVWDTDESVDPLPIQVVVLTQTVWEQDYGASPDVIGQPIEFDNQMPATIVGVAPRSMEVFDARVRGFIPRRVGGGIANTYLWARLRPGVTHEQAIGQLQSIERHWYDEVANAATRVAVDLDQLTFEIGRPDPLRTPLMLLQAGTLLVLFVGCLNVINLCLSYGLRRSRELAVRYALGAGGIGVARLMLCEGLWLAAVSAWAGALVAWVALSGLNGYLATLLPAAAPVGFDGAVLAWSVSIAGALALVIGLLPAAVLWRSGRLRHPDRGARAATAGLTARRMGGALVVSQVAVTVALLVASGLLFRSLINVLAVDPGFEAARVVTARVSLTGTYEPSEYVNVRGRILAAVRAIPGVERVSFEGNHQMLGSYLQTAPFTVRSGVAGAGTSPVPALVKNVDADYFGTMGIPVLQGRTFAADEEVASFMVDQSFVDRYFDGQQVVGSEIAWGRQARPVIGIVGRANFEGLDARDGLPVVYVSRAQTPWERFTLVVRTTADPDNTIAALQRVLRGINPALSPFAATPLADALATLHLGRRGTAILTGVFAGLALVLSAIGIYGVLAYDVEQRRKELGIRCAIGASPGRVLALVMGHGVGKTITGLLLGLVGALVLSRFLESRLFDVTTHDPATYLAASAVVCAVALVAIYLPARRALRLQLIDVLRSD